MAKLIDICDIQYGFPFNSSLFSDTNGVPVIRIRDVKRGYSETYTTENYKEEYIVHKNDFLIGMDGEFNIAKWGETPALLNQRVCRLFPSDNIDRNYLFYFMQNKLKEIEARTPFATVKHLSAKEINKIEFPVQDLKTQQSRGILLAQIDYLVSIRKQQLATLDELVKARFVEMFGDPVHNSKGLPTKKLNELGSIDRGRSKHRPRNAPELLNGPYPLIQTGEVANAGLYITEYQNTYSEIGLQQSKMWKAGTLCITIAANIAQTAILNFDACFPDSVVGFIPYGDVDVIYMHYWFCFFRKILEEQAPQVAQKNINLKILAGLDVVVPTHEQQTQFAAFVQSTDQTKSTIQAGIDQLETLKKSLMQEYFG